MSWFLGFSVFQINYTTSTYYPIDKLVQDQIFDFLGDLYPREASSDRILKYLPDYYHSVDEFKELAETSTTELDTVSVAIEQTLNDQFVATASIQAIKKREQELGIQAVPSESLRFRRERILNRYQTKPPFTIRYLQNRLNHLIGDGLAMVSADYQNFVLTITTNIKDAIVFKEIEHTVRVVKPVNLVYQQQTGLEDTLEIKDRISKKDIIWNYKFSGWSLGEKPFADFGEEVIIK
ncbi:hypothetical protein D3C74_309760 [compost metagenome]